MKRLLFILLLFAPRACGEGALSPWFVPTFTTNGVAPLANGFVCSTVSGSITPLATFQDPALMTANQNPIRLNATGQPVNGTSLVSIFIQPAVYRFTLYAAGTANLCNGVRVGALVRQIDNVFDFGALFNNLGANNTYTGNNTFTGTTTFTGPITGSPLTVSSNASIGGNLTVSGSTTTTGALSAGTTASIGSNFTAHANATVGLHLSVLGSAAIAGALTADSILNANGGILATQVQITAIDAADLPTCNSGAEGVLIPVTTSMSVVFNDTIMAGGTEHVLAYCNGAAWKVH